VTPELYSRVVAARPEAAVPSLVHYTGDEWHVAPNFRCSLSGEIADCLILAHWLGLLPPDTCLYRGDNAWCVGTYGKGDGGPDRDTPTAALAAYLMEAKA